MNQVTVSEIKLFQQCPALWAYRYVARTAPRREAPSALTRGTITHRAFERAVAENWGKDEWLPWLSQAYLDECITMGAEPRDDHFNELEVVAERAGTYWVTYGRHFTYNATELVLATPRFRGTIDAVISEGNATWALQYKTIGKVAWVPSLVRLVKRSLHESLYKDLMLENGYTNYAGTRLVAIPLDPLHTRQAGSLCPHCDKKGLAWRNIDCAPIDLSINSRITKRRETDLIRVLTQIELAREACARVDWPLCGGPPPVEQRGEATFGCMAPWGNRPLCPFIDMCDEEPGASLFNADDWRSVDPNERYLTVEVE